MNKPEKKYSGKKLLNSTSYLYNSSLEPLWRQILFPLISWWTELRSKIPQDCVIYWLQNIYIFNHFLFHFLPFLREGKNPDRI